MVIFHSKDFEDQLEEERMACLYLSISLCGAQTLSWKVSRSKQGNCYATATWFLSQSASNKVSCI